MKLVVLFLALMVSQPGWAQTNTESNKNQTDDCPLCRSPGALDPSVLIKNGIASEVKPTLGDNAGNGGNATKNSVKPKHP